MPIKYLQKSNCQTTEKTDKPLRAPAQTGLLIIAGSNYRNSNHFITKLASRRQISKRKRE